jgi:hypothetical protein
MANLKDLLDRPLARMHLLETKFTRTPAPIIPTPNRRGEAILIQSQECVVQRAAGVG